MRCRQIPAGTPGDARGVRRGLAVIVKGSRCRPLVRLYGHLLRARDIVKVLPERRPRAKRASTLMGLFTNFIASLRRRRRLCPRANIGFRSSHNSLMGWRGRSGGWGTNRCHRSSCFQIPLSDVFIAQAATPAGPLAQHGAGDMHTLTSAGLESFKDARCSRG